MGGESDWGGRKMGGGLENGGKRGKLRGEVGFFYWGGKGGLGAECGAAGWHQMGGGEKRGGRKMGGGTEIWGGKMGVWGRCSWGRG